MRNGEVWVMQNEQLVLKVQTLGFNIVYCHVPFNDNEGYEQAAVRTEQ